MLRNPIRPRLSSATLRLILAGLGIAVLFVALNSRAYDGFFQDDEFENLKWAPSLPAMQFARGLLSPEFQPDNFRPVGHLYFALMGKAFGLDFPPYMTPVFAIHLLNALLLYLLIRKLGVERWCALAAAAFFALSATAFDAYWKPMYVFDLLCTTFSLACILLYAHRRWILSFIAFWLAYKAKELAVMLPAVLAVYEYWLGERRFRVLIPFLLVALSFGVQGIVRNPNRDNDYTFRFTLDALRRTAPFYARRFLFFPFSGLALFALAFVRDRRVWFGLAAMSLLLAPLLFLPGRLFEAYTYLPLSCAAIALAAAASHVNPKWAWLALLLWMPFNVRHLRSEQRAKLALDDKTFVFVDTLARWAAQNPSVETLVFDGAPAGFHDWGVTGAWNAVHNRIDLPVLYVGWPQTPEVRARNAVAYGHWDRQRGQLTVGIRLPGQ